MPRKIHDKLAKVVLIALLNLTVFVLVFTELPSPSKKHYKCTIDQLLTTISDFIESDGRISIEKSILGSCENKLSRHATRVWQLKRSIENLVYRRNARAYVPPPYEDNEPIITLFTSWLSTDEKTDVHRNTVSSWSTFLPRVNLVVFYKRFCNC